jgi:hypothetical protein
MNRTKVIQHLKESGLHQIVHAYKNYYQTGWDLFLSDFSSSDQYRKVIQHGISVLQGCITVLKEIDDGA